MAADPRQFTEHNEVGGANVYYEDKRMEELKSAAPKTDSQISTTDEYIPLQDTDGNLVKINPASFQEAVRNVLGGLLANNDKGVTISGIPALSGSGASLDFGSVTPANLASVLGVNHVENRERFRLELMDLEASFKAATEYSIFQGATSASSEAAWYGFKRTINKASYAIIMLGGVGIWYAIRNAGAYDDYTLWTLYNITSMPEI